MAGLKCLGGNPANYVYLWVALEAEEEVML